MNLSCGIILHIHKNYICGRGAEGSLTTVPEMLLAIVVVEAMLMFPTLAPHFEPAL